ncbi:peptidase G2 autoproteolytic cleavage domain-containing protein [Bacillus sp. FSL K6-1234]|uniref:peptidase G2 autoproteolytic cleavage domain-containing protein n=1 Tax=Bacillus sp. FSL K6-1234 TaxID=2976832 RepID=UPI0030FC7506
MIYLNKRHEVTPNSNLFDILDNNARLTEKGLNDTVNALNFHKKAKVAHTADQVTYGGFTVKSFLDFFHASYQNMIAAKDGEDVKELIDLRVSPIDGKTFATAQGRMIHDYNYFKKKIDRVVHVDDFGAVADGVTDCTQAFKDAIGEGNVEVHFSAGTYVGLIKVPSNCRLIGEGQGITIIKLPEETPAEEWVLTNTTHELGNEGIYVEGISLDWNKDRQGGLRAAGGIKSSCATFANVKYLWVKDCNAINAGLHGFDITAPSYDRSAEVYPNYTAQGCKYVWIDNCTASNYGDDGITTHYSEYVFINNCHCINPSGEAHAEGVSNSNGIEVDDGSKNVWLFNNFTSGNSRGVEVKAHKLWPASRNVHITNHVSYRDTRSYDLRHIGHHLANEPWSDTARDVTLVNCTSIEPVYNNNVYKDLSPRALVISAYQRVQILGFTAIGDPSYDYKDSPMIVFQYKSRKITLDGLLMSGFAKASSDIYVTGGDQRTDDVIISNFHVHDSAPVGIALGGGVYYVNLTNGFLHTRGGTTGITSPNTQANMINVRAVGYENAAIIAGQKYSSVPTNIKGGFRAASSSGHPLTDTSVILAVTGGATAKGDRNAIIASSGGSSTESSRQAVFASNNSHTKGDGASRVVLASQGVVNDNNYSVRGGYADSGASTANTKWELDSMYGNILGTGRVESVSDFKDYAEYFESVDGKQIDSGYLVTLEGDKIRKALKGDEILGVISETAGVVLGGAGFYWNDRYLRNEFGGLIYETVDENGRQLKRPKENPDYNPEIEYVSRENRPEWHIVGLIGQVHVRIDETVQVGDKVTAKYGKGTKSEDGTGLKVMRIKQPYTKEKGYGVAIVFMR